MDLTIFWWEWIIILSVILFCIFFATTLWGVIFYASPFVPSSSAKARKIQNKITDKIIIHSHQKIVKSIIKFEL
jgi:predicted membrane-bound dolichyl-phosphate-mannose-protein mannosyltransferase